MSGGSRISLVREYQLLSEAEWEYAARAGTETARYWGDDPSEQCRYANGFDEAGHAVRPSTTIPRPGCTDGYAATAPAGAFLPNGFGLYDMLGNVAEWTEGCLLDEYVDASGACEMPVKRGGGWGGGFNMLRSARRGAWLADSRDSGTGFRVAESGWNKVRPFKLIQCTPAPNRCRSRTTAGSFHYCGATAAPGQLQMPNTGNIFRC